MVKQERAARTRESLVLAAAEVFAEEGFAAASIAAISERAGVTSGAVQFHFDGKPALARAVEARAARRLRRIAEEEGEPERSGAPLRVLVESTYALLELLAGDVVVRAGFALGADAGHRSRVDLRGQCGLWAEGLMVAAERAGLLAEGVSPKDATRVVVASTVGLRGLRAVEPEWTARQALSRIWTVILPGIALDETAAPAGEEPAAGELPEQETD
ncbi:ScbR family autoregulator-binding transcription factor [Streptomyces sp. NBC_00091]|uniref:ScbR family autoregulator-binding transcription factor n=1 Tax=Streptomyces sp. NBC_00091 TaxID=2975648 RepID=UPI00224F605F|nr:ScbR family autoregulator-binding transcription factor [Streptomyces sp. NBC_00091]MCX5381243.1 ScbR family autoregulator-binding transcription factor [Streptomyces sp. NBC_00091]